MILGVRMVSTANKTLNRELAGRGFESPHFQQEL